MKKSPLQENRQGFAFKNFSVPKNSEQVFVNELGDIFSNLDFLKSLEKQKIHNLFFVGYSTNHCIAASAKTALNLGYEVFIVEEVTAASSIGSYKYRNIDASTLQKVTLAHLEESSVNILSFEQFLSSWINSRHPE